MKKIYEMPEVDIELFAFEGEIYTTSGSLEDIEQEGEF